MLILFVLYPVISYLLGNTFPEMVTYIMPCPIVSVSIAVYSSYHRKNRLCLLYTSRSAAVKILHLGCHYVLVKGGHLPEDAVDILYDGENFTAFTAPKVATENTHGTGCTLSSALAVYLGRGLSAAEAVQAAKTYLTKALAAGRTMQIGHGHGPVCHHFALLEDN